MGQAVTTVSRQARRIAAPSAEPFIYFVSANPDVDFSFLYPSTWRMTETDEESRSQILIRGPRNAQDTYSTALFVTRARAEPPMSLDRKAAELLELSGKARGFMVLSNAKGMLLGCKAIELTLSYTLALPLNSVRPYETQIIERRVLFQKTHSFYEIVYRAVADDYPEYLYAFETVVRTFEFADVQAGGYFQTLVTTEPALALRDASEEYKTVE